MEDCVHLFIFSCSSFDDIGFGGCAACGIVILRITFVMKKKTSLTLSAKKLYIIHVKSEKLPAA